jgi:MFS family permease
LRRRVLLAGLAVFGVSSLTAGLASRAGSWSPPGSSRVAAGIWYVSRVPLHGSYPSDLLPGFLVMSLGAGSVFVSVTAAANAGVPSDQAGLAAGLLNSSQQIGSALGLAILSAVAITRTDHLIAGRVSPAAAADAGYHQALLVGAITMAAAALVALRIGNTRNPAPLVMVSTEAAPEPYHAK